MANADSRKKRVFIWRRKRFKRFHIPVSVVLGFTIAFYILIIHSGNDPLAVMNTLHMDSIFCLSETKPHHLSDPKISGENTQLRLVVAYMRGGSTLTADLVRHTDRDFYVYEPLHGLMQAVQRNVSVQFLNGTERYISKGELESVYTEMIYHWFTCNFHKIDLPSLRDPFIETHTPEHSAYYYCINPRNTTKSALELVKLCIPLLEIKCLNYKSRTIKTIRLPVDMAGKLLKWLPGLKILHLVRDPRGIVNSQFEQVITDGKNVSTSAEELCQTIDRNEMAFSKLERCHGSRMLGVVYENLCQNPHSMVNKIFEFFGNRYSKRVRDFVDKMMQGPVRICSYCTERGDAIANAYRWISVISLDKIQIVDSHCSFLYSYFGYMKLDYNKLNTTKFSWKPSITEI